MSGGMNLVTATSRVRFLATGCPFPYGAGGTLIGNPLGQSTPISVHSMEVRAANGNAGTVYLNFAPTALAGITCVAAGRGATIREQTMIPLTHGQSVTFTAMGRGSDAPRKIMFGTGYSYVFGSATSQRVICTYLKEK